MPEKSLLETIAHLEQQIERTKIRAMERYFEAGRPEDMQAGQRAIGAQRALDELKLRLRNENPGTPDWMRPLLEPSDMDSRLRPAPVSSNPPEDLSGINRRVSRKYREKYE